MRFTSAVLVLLALTLAVSVAQAQKKTKPSQAELDGITQRGRLLADSYQATKRATDALRKRGPLGPSVKRYVPYRSEDGWKVAFGTLNDEQSAFLVAYEVSEVQGTTELRIESFEPPQPRDGYLAIAARAVETAITDFSGAKVRYSLAVLPVEPGIFVYFFPAQTQEDVFLMGADVRYHIAADGRTTLEKRVLHKTLLPFSTQAKDKQQRTSAAGWHTHVLTELPEDTDVMYVLLRKPSVPEAIGAGGLIFEIGKDGRIKILK